MQSPLTFKADLLLQDNRIFKILQDFNEHDWLHARDFYQNFNPSGNVLSARKGIDKSPFRLNHDYYNKNSIMPAYNPDFDKSFSQVTDERAKDIENKLSPTQKICVDWSGGVDSTVILAAVLKNCNSEKIVVNLNQTSIFENPLFYYKFIDKKVETRNSNYFIDLDSNEYIVLTGQPEIPACKHYIKLLLKNSTVFDEAIIDGYNFFLDNVVKPEYRQTFTKHYENILENINDVQSDYPIIKTFGDFVWWEYFNFDYKGKNFADFYNLATPENNIESWMNTFVCWYDYPEYQRWIMKNKGSGKTHGKNLAEWRLEHKKYIYDFDGNEYYYKYTSKMSSDSRVRSDRPIAVTTEDFRNLTLEDNFDEIVSLLPSIINTKV